jgi:hypothetical protein
MSSLEMKIVPPQDQAAFATKRARLSRSRRRGSFVLALLVALGVTACTGGAGLDVPIGPVDHSCPVAYSCEHK